MWNREKCVVYSRPVRFLVFLPRPARTRIVATHFRARANGLRRFGLRRPGLILQIFLLALLAAFDFARHGGQLLRLARACRGASDSGSGALRRRARPVLLGVSPPPRALALLPFEVGQVGKRFLFCTTRPLFAQRGS